MEQYQKIEPGDKPKKFTKEQIFEKINRVLDESPTKDPEGYEGFFFTAKNGEGADFTAEGTLVNLAALVATSVVSVNNEKFQKQVVNTIREFGAISDGNDLGDLLQSIFSDTAKRSAEREQAKRN